MNDPMGMPHALHDHDRFDRVLVRAAEASAFFGGGGFILLIAMSVVSIVKRKAGYGSIEGDIELMQVGTAIFAAAFLPFCTLLGEHLKVEFFTEKAPERLRAHLDGIADFLLTVLFALLVWRTGHYAWSLRQAGEVTPLVSLPVWIPVALIVPSLALACVCAGYRCARLFGASFGASRPMTRGHG